MSDWTELVTKTYNDKKKKNPSYKFKHAMKDAAKMYKKGGVSSKKMKSCKNMRKKNGTRKMRK